MRRRSPEKARSRGDARIMCGDRKEESKLSWTFCKVKNCLQTAGNGTFGKEGAGRTSADKILQIASPGSAFGRLAKSGDLFDLLYGSRLK